MTNVMIVEDEYNVAEGLKGIIISINKDIDVFITGYAKEALEESRNLKYDLFLLDIQLLDYSGLELAKELREIKEYKFTPIVFITAIPTKELIAFKQTHCYDYIIKPFKEKEVVEVLDEILNYGIKKEDYISFDMKKYIYRVKIDDIIYIEAVQRRIKVVTINEQFYLSHYTLENLANELTRNFIRCHNGFIVNVNYISGIDKSNNYIDIRGIKEKIPIGKKYKDNLRSALHEFL